MMRIIAVVGIAIAVAALVVATSIGIGFEKQYTGALLDFNAHLIVMGTGEIRNPSEVDGKIEALKRKDVVGVTPFIYREALSIGGGKIRGVVVKGIDPNTLRDVNKMEISIKDGRTLEDSLKAADKKKVNIIVGLALFDSFGKSNTIKLMIPGEGEDRFIEGDVVGTFESGIYDYDAQFLLVSLSEARRIYKIKGDAVSGLELKLKDPFMADSMADMIEGILGASYEVTTWGELNRDLLAAVHLEKLVSAIIMGMMVLVAMLNIVAVIVLTAIHRFHEISILKAIGLPNRIVESIFIRGGISIDVMGSALGIVTGIGIAAVVGHYDLVPLDAEIYLIESLPIDISPLICGMISTFCLVVGYLTTKIASRKLSGASIAEGLSCTK